jgi:mono/diheme cytochrome c family protein
MPAKASAKRVDMITSSSRPNAEAKLSGRAVAGEQLFMRSGCFACHGKAGAGGLAPAIAPLIAKVSNEELKGILQKPTVKMRTGGMPAVQATSEEMEVLLSYLRTLPAPHSGGMPGKTAAPE